MIVTYAPHGAPVREFVLNPVELFMVGPDSISAVGGDLWVGPLDFLEALNQGRLRAFRALLWLVLRREDPDLEFDALAVRPGEVSVRPDSEEIERARQVAWDDPGIRLEVLDLINDVEEAAR